jgi:hypothetical protein
MGFRPLRYISQVQVNINLALVSSATRYNSLSRTHTYSVCGSSILNAKTLSIWKHVPRCETYKLPANSTYTACQWQWASWLWNMVKTDPQSMGSCDMKWLQLSGLWVHHAGWACSSKRAVKGEPMYTEGAISYSILCLKNPSWKPALLASWFWLTFLLLSCHPFTFTAQYCMTVTDSVAEDQKV